MLKTLSIDNFAIIDNLNVDFNAGLTTVTGETGAGKSIILGALSLILGQRADLKSLRSEDRKCVVEAVFDISAYGLKDLFEKLDIEFEENTIIRREIHPNGKSRAFVNDSPVLLDVLQELGENLLDIHSQHQTLALSASDFQMEVVDAVADNSKLLESYRANHKSMRSVKKELDELKHKQQEISNNYDFNLFLFNELQQANLAEGQKQSMEEELESLNRADEIKSSMASALQIIKNEDIGLSANLLELKASLYNLKGVSKQIDDFIQRVESLIIESNDLTLEIEKVYDNTEHDPALIESYNSKLQTIYDLEKKHRVEGENQLIVLMNDLKREIDMAENFDHELAQLEAKLKASLDKLNLVADELHLSRTNAAKVLKSQVESIVSELGMPNAEFEANLERIDSFEKNGASKIKFMLRANKGSKIDELSKVASGGELSRVMLAIKTILSSKKRLPSIIFDEIDTGVSGEIAGKIAGVMSKMSKNMQVISISHLPQIASKGDWHYRVYKYEDGDVVNSSMVLLSFEQRVEELAKMLSGDKISDSAIVHARELLSMN